MTTNDDLMTALRQVPHPKTGKDVVSSGTIQSANVNGDIITITLQIDATDAKQMEITRKACEDAALALPGIKKARAIMTAQQAHSHGNGAKPKVTPPPKPKPMQGVKHVIAVASGKGGVGKSTTAVNLAYALHAMGYKIGLIDCDVYGPSASVLLGVTAKPEFTEDDRIKPVMVKGIAAISMSFIIDPDTAAIWRGPMVISAIQQFLNGVEWDMHGELDFAIADMPPGTGDVQLTMAQTVHVDGALIVSTPQDIALIDARKAVDMYRKTETPILGLVENMSYYSCPHCGERSDIFGHDGARLTAQEKGIPFIGEIPLHADIRESSDAGEPIVLSQPQSPYAAIYRDIAAALVKNMAV